MLTIIRRFLVNSGKKGRCTDTKLDQSVKYHDDVKERESFAQNGLIIYAWILKQKYVNTDSTYLSISKRYYNYLNIIKNVELWIMN